MITIDGVTYRNLEEQVRFNQQNINTSATAIAAETERAKAAEAANATAIAAETERAKAAEAANATAIAAETERAKAAEAANATNIATNTANITIESDRISAVSSDLAAFETDVANTYLPSATAASTYATIVNFNALDGNVVKLTGDQTVAGNKTFSNIVNGTNGFSVGLGSNALISRTDSDGNRLALVQENNNGNYYICQYRPLAGATDKTYQNIIFPNKAGTVSLTGDVVAINFDNNNPSIGGISFYGSKCKLPLVGNCSDSGVGLRSKNDSCSATGINAVAIGSGSTASNSGTIAIGQSPSATADGSISVGRNSSSSNSDSIAIGPNTISSAANSLAIGNAAHATSGAANIAIGNGAVSDGTQTTAIGNSFCSS
jgi:hypothetical protein